MVKANDRRSAEAMVKSVAGVKPDAEGNVVVTFTLKIGLVKRVQLLMKFQVSEYDQNQKLNLQHDKNCCNHADCSLESVTPTTGETKI